MHVVFIIEFVLLLIAAHLFSKPFFSVNPEGYVSVSLFVGGTGAGLFLAGALFLDGVTGKIALSGGPLNVLPVILATLLFGCSRVFDNRTGCSYAFFFMLSLLTGALALARVPNAALLVGLLYGLMITLLGYVCHYSHKKTMLPDVH